MLGTTPPRYKHLANPQSTLGEYLGAALTTQQVRGF